MSNPTAAPSARTRLSALFFGVFLVSGAQAPFLPVWLGLKGFSVEEIGWLLALPRAMQVVSLPLAARWADRGGRIIAQLLAGAAVATGVYLAMGFFSRGPALVGLLVALFLVLSTAMPLLDVFAYTLPPENGAKIAFGPVRKWGSVGFVSGSLLAGVALNALGAPLLPALLAIAGLATIGSCVFALPLDSRPRLHSPDDGHPHARIGLALVAVIAVETLVQGSHTQLGAMASVHWAAMGRSNVFIGAAWAIGVVSETFAFAYMGGLFGPGSGRRLFFIGAASSTLRWVAMAFDPPGGVVLALQAMHGLTFATTHIGAMEMVAELTPPANRGFTQGSMIAATSGLNAVLAAMSGGLETRFGQGAYFGMAAIALAGLALVGALRGPALKPLQTQI